MSDFKPTKEQLQILEQLKVVTEPHYVYSDQMMAIAMWINAEFEHKSKANEVNKQPDTKALPLHGVSFSEDCECDNTEVCGICFRKKGYEMIDNKLTLTGETEVCDKCEETFTYAGEYRNICFGCEDDFI